MTNDEIDEMARNIVLDLSARPTEKVLATRLVELLDAQVGAVEPRVWRGTLVHPPSKPYWWWQDSYGWRDGGVSMLYDGDIFLPGNAPKPTESPGPAELLEECSVVDW